MARLTYRILQHEKELNTPRHFFRVAVWQGEPAAGEPDLVTEMLLQVGPSAVTEHFTRLEGPMLFKQTQSGAWLYEQRISPVTGEWEYLPPAGPEGDPWRMRERAVDRTDGLLQTITKIVRAEVITSPLHPPGRRTDLFSVKDRPKFDRRPAEVGSNQDLDALVGQTFSLEVE